MSRIKLASIFAIAIIISSCASREKSHLQEADNFSYRSEAFFQKAVKAYQDILKQAPADNLAAFKLAQLYFNHGDYQQCIECSLNREDLESRKLLARCYYKTSDYTSAISVYNKIGELEDDEYLFYYGMACEKQNLFDPAKKLYGKIKSAKYLALALMRLQAIDASSKEKELSILEPEVARIIKEAPSQELYPQAGALVLLADEKIEILPEDTLVSYQHYIIKILNERGKKYAEVDVDYDSTFEKVELDFARTINPDGEVAVVGNKHIRDVSRYLDFPLYSNARALIISMPEVTVGSTIEYRIKVLRSQMVAKNEFSTGYFLQNEVPVILAKFKVTIPKGRELKLKFVNQQYNYFSAQVEPRVTQSDDKKIYTWEFRDIPEIIGEPSMPPASEINTTILLSTFKSWESIYNWWWNLAKDKIEVSAKMKELVRELTLNLKTDTEKARAIYNWCIENIRYVAIEYGQAGFEPHRAIDVFSNKYGDCKDQAILLISLMKEAGVSAYPVLISTRDNFSIPEDFPILLFDHAIAAVDIKGELIFLDPTAETVSFGDLPVGDQDRKVLVFQDGGHKIVATPDFKPQHNSIETYTNFKINRDETVLAERQVKTNGYYDQMQRYHLRYTQPIIFEDSLKEKIHSFVPGGKLLDYKIENLKGSDKPIELIYNFSGPEFLTKAGAARIIPQLGYIDLSIVAKDARLYPIDFSSLSQEKTVLTFELPRNLRVKFLPQTIKYNTKWMSFANFYSLENGNLVFTQVHTIKKKNISAPEYKLFKASLQQLSRKIKQCLILEKEGL